LIEVSSFGFASFFGPYHAGCFFLFPPVSFCSCFLFSRVLVRNLICRPYILQFPCSSLLTTFSLSLSVSIQFPRFRDRQRLLYSFLPSFVQLKFFEAPFASGFHDVRTNRSPPSFPFSPLSISPFFFSFCMDSTTPGCRLGPSPSLLSMRA